MNLMQVIENEQLKENIPEFSIGDTIQVHYRIIEGKNERIQVFEGIVIARNNAGISESFTVRKISNNIGVERVFPLHSPRIEKILRLRMGRVRRAKLYYLRNRRGKAARVPELIRKKTQAPKHQTPEPKESPADSQ